MSPAGPLIERLNEYIIANRLGPGDRLPAERALAELLGVSRPALRETLRQLVARGILEPRRGSGTYLARIDLAEVLAVRLQLEPFATELAARHRTPEQLAALEARLDEMHATAADVAAFVRADMALHGIVAEASGNRILAGALADLDQLLSFVRTQLIRGDGLRGRSLAEMDGIVAAIRAGDPEAAGAAMREHLRAVNRDGATPS